MTAEEDARRKIVGDGLAMIATALESMKIALAQAQTGASMVLHYTPKPSRPKQPKAKLEKRRGEGQGGKHAQGDLDPP